MRILVETSVINIFGERSSVSGQYVPASDDQMLNCHHHQAEKDVFQPKVDQKTSVSFQFEITRIHTDKRKEGRTEEKLALLSASPCGCWC
jgi:hypothetical protein